jgi:type VI secretion system protein ImpF
MSGLPREQFFTPSLLDRLCDKEPKNPNETQRERVQRIADLKESVKNDLQDLLNTRIPFPFPPDRFRQIRKSILNYGIPDLNRVSVDSTRSIEALRKDIEDAIRTYETRFVSIHVELDREGMSHLSRTIEFRIEGELHAEPDPEMVVYSSRMHASTRRFEVKDSSE